MGLNWSSIARTHSAPTGPAAFDADLSAQNILAAATEGFYCFPASSPEETLINEIRYAADTEFGNIHINLDTGDPYSVAWLCPDRRPITDLVTRRTGRTMRRFARLRAEWRTSIDTAFDAVVDACSNGREATWITDTVRASLRELHRDGVAHSCEVWNDDRLIGGVFGLQLGAVFTADSQFTLVEGAGKLAVVDLTTRFIEGGGRILDFQHESEHAKNLGATSVPRATYLDALRHLRQVSVTIPREERHAAHIAEPVTV
ncbi:hypothetical protein [Rhodococcus sp. IEGM 1330]|uniref:leucyl/phenylalanyl-tRNA--protein transferase n=1 Tax=Rhodococcus sp. IEGM 1330 TaxID=3082225 RepID=UPI0029553E3C|nr:hypothetical protein [Rhodococcus sp. IEGM 1330]MDV8022661.1 hypothetical protein [Rhodococcus sp. IEGM 1330]